ncbi:hypothetical protein [Acinetobacter sp. CE-15]|uniref:hypothetical protein n=1 Tax=Acinetobacter sp. CE-15 TaxID=3425693 RepID=UPI003DA5F9DA
MGFSLLFIRIKNQEIVDADRDGLARFLAENQLYVHTQVGSGALVDQNEKALAFNGYLSDLYLDPLEQSEPITGGIYHATLSEEECIFIYDLCVAGKMLIVNPQTNPMYLIPTTNHEQHNIPDLNDAVWVNSAAEMLLVLSQGFNAFKVYKEKVMRQYHDKDHPQA